MPSLIAKCFGLAAKHVRYCSMVENHPARQPSLFDGWLLTAGFLTSILILNRGLLWLYGFPEGLVAFMVTVAGIGIVTLMSLMVRRQLPDWLCAPPWIGFKGFKNWQVILYWLVWGWLMAAFFEGHDRIEVPTLSFVVTIEDIVDTLITGTIVGVFLGFFVLVQRQRPRKTGDG